LTWFAGGASFGGSGGGAACDELLEGAALLEGAGALDGAGLLEGAALFDGETAGPPQAARAPNTLMNTTLVNLEFMPAVCNTLSVKDERFCFHSCRFWCKTEAMCWSAEVSAAFAAFEWAGIGWLVKRNQGLDRAFALAVSPIAAQEVLQWVLWEHIASSLTECDRVNIVGGLLVRQITGTVPLAWVWFAQHGSPKKRLARILLAVTAAYVVLRGAMVMHSYWVGPQLCTTVGPHHHQAWPPYLGRHVDLQPGLDIVFFSLYWMLPVGSLVLFRRPMWITVSLCAIMFGTMVPCLLWYSGEELGSVWCWSCSMLLAMALLVPRIQRELDARSA